MSIHRFLSATALVLVSASASQSMTLPVRPGAAVQEVHGLKQVSFWGQAFPYRYNWSRMRACTRLEPVETARGIRVQRVWVCSVRRH